MKVWYCRYCQEGHEQEAAGICPTCGSTMMFNPYGSVLQAATIAAALNEEYEREDVEFPIPLATVSVKEREDGRLTVSSHALIRAGLTQRFQEGDLIAIPDEGVIEILGYSYTGRVYVARRFETQWPDYIPKGWRRKRKKKEKE